MSDGETLLACPFCGGEVEYQPGRTRDECDWIAHKPIVGGHDCALEEFSAFSLVGGDFALRAAWSTRAALAMPIPAPSGQREVLRATQSARSCDEPSAYTVTVECAVRAMLTFAAEAVKGEREAVVAYLRAARDAHGSVLPETSALGREGAAYTIDAAIRYDAAARAIEEGEHALSAIRSRGEVERG